MSRRECENKYCKNLTTDRWCKKCMHDNRVVKTCRCGRGEYLNDRGFIIPSCYRESCLCNAYISLHSVYLNEKNRGKQFVAAEKKRNEKEIESLRVKLVAERRSKDEITKQSTENLVQTKDRLRDEEKIVDDLSRIARRHDEDMAELKRKHRSELELANRRNKEGLASMMTEVHDSNRRIRELERAAEEAQKTIISLTAKNEVLSSQFDKTVSMIAPRSPLAMNPSLPIGYLHQQFKTRPSPPQTQKRTPSPPKVTATKNPDTTDPRKRSRDESDGVPQNDADVEKAMDPTLHVIKEKKMKEIVGSDVLGL